MKTQEIKDFFYRRNHKGVPIPVYVLPSGEEVQERIFFKVFSGRHIMSHEEKTESGILEIPEWL